MNESPADEPGGSTAPRNADWTATPSPVPWRSCSPSTSCRPICTCAHCGRTGPLAQYDLYADSPALVLRCVGCAGVVLRYSSAGGRIRLDMSGTRLLALHLPEQT